jgi:aryl-alcohol dehydrogenase-like predicted oxidoreductase
MKYVKLKNIEIPAIAMGTWSWGTGINGGDQVFGNEYNEEDLRPVFNKAMEKGFVLWDTAAVYGMGASETILGGFMKDKKDVIISTKFTPYGEQGQSAMKESLDESIERMGVNSVDIYWIHNPKNVEQWTKEIIPLVKCGKIKHVGVSNHTLDDIKLAANILEKEGLQLSAVQNHYSLLYRASEEAGIIDWCHKNDVVFFSYMVLEQGALSNKYNANNPFKSGTRRGEAFNADVLGKLEGLIDVMSQIGGRYQSEPSQIAMAWAISKGTVPIIGVTKESHIDGALYVLDINLEAKEIAELEEAARNTGISIKGEWEKDMI